MSDMSQATPEEHQRLVQLRFDELLAHAELSNDFIDRMLENPQFVQKLREKIFGHAQQAPQQAPQPRQVSQKRNALEIVLGL